MNAFDDPDGDGVVLDVVRHPSMFRTQHLGPFEGAPTLERWHLDGHGGAVKEERLDDRGQEFPASTSAASACPTATATPSRSASPTTSSAPSRCCSATTSSGGRARPVPSGAGPAWARRSSSPATDGAGESDGWLLLLVHSAETGTSALHILNADDIAGEAQAVVELPQRVPAGFHGNWVPDQA